MPTKRKRKSSRDASDISPADRKILLEIATHLRDFHSWTIWKGETPPHARPDDLNPGGRPLEGPRASAYAQQIERILDPFVPDLSPAERKNWAMAMEYHLRKCIAQEKEILSGGTEMAPLAKDILAQVAANYGTTGNNVQHRYTDYRAAVEQWTDRHPMTWTSVETNESVTLTRLQHLETLLARFCL